MQTLISVFDDRAQARRAVERLVQAGVDRQDVHLQEAGEARAAIQGNPPTGEDHTITGEREIAMDRGVLDAFGHFFVSIFGADHGEKAAGTYGGAMSRGNSVVLVDAHDDSQAEACAVILHECGAIDVDDRDVSGGTPTKPGVRLYEREAPTLRSLSEHRHLREESLLADRAGQVSKEMKQDREERAYASNMTHVDRDRPK